MTAFVCESPRHKGNRLVTSTPERPAIYQMLERRIEFRAKWDESRYAVLLDMKVCKVCADEEVIEKRHSRRTPEPAPGETLFDQEAEARQPDQPPAPNRMADVKAALEQKRKAG